MNEMNIEKAIEILELHNKWRRNNDGIYEMAEPKELGKAIDLVINEFNNLHLQNVSGSALEVAKQIPQASQTQMALNDQLKILRVAANKLGLYDAADFIRRD